MPRAQADPLSTGDRVLSGLREDIRTLSLAPGQKLSAELLVARYGAGQSPVREALSLLAGEGLVVRESRRGFRVGPMSLADLDDVIAARLTVELALLERSLAQADATWDERVRDAFADLLPSLQKVGDARPLDRAWEANHRRFHFALLAGSAPSVMMEFCRILYDRYDRYRLLAIPRRAFLAGVADDHAELVEAACARDVGRALAILRRHIADTSAMLRANIVEADLLSPGAAVEPRDPVV
ncbi:GntR family transcriptional regulator [Aquabacter spiritensis]|uniref:DNA-binding GntR family transcriptional regulator n=1 Tax=Aquabacter spiritensis TaxID=933073 RepID=A0A4R3M0L2_9HYPH|nr:GntR family transcriptional regulator [Aquabacter spiritensis]TCT04627.1 DNA-binding GntR family transcriptional regulator [Aquabacter spiritensis]